MSWVSHQGWFVGLVLGIAVAAAMVALPARAQATITLTTVDNNKVLVVRVEGLDPGARYNVLLIDPHGGEHPFVIEANTNGVISDSITVEPTDPDGMVTIEIRAVESDEVVASVDVEVRNTAWVLPQQSSAVTPTSAATPLPGMPNTGAGGMRTDGDYTVSWVIVALASALVLAGLSARIARARRG